MTVMEINAKELELIQEINSDVNLLDTLLKYVRKLKDNQHQPPCQFTREEIGAILLKGEEDAKNNLGILHEDLKNEFASW